MVRFFVRLGREDKFAYVLYLHLKSLYFYLDTPNYQLATVGDV